MERDGEEEQVEVVAARRVALSTRTTPDLRARLNLAAADSGRSLAQEVEFRLEQSFTANHVNILYTQLGHFAEKVYGTIGNGDTGQLLMELARAIKRMEEHQGVSWTDEKADMDAYEMDLRSAMAGFRMLRNKGGRRKIHITDFIMTDEDEVLATGKKSDVKRV